MATIYIHIGAPKTATSTLQSTLAGNYRKLLKNGVLYPKAPRHGDAHHLLVCDLIEKYQKIRMPEVWYGDRARGEAWDLLASEIKRHEQDVHSVILSSELFFGQKENIESMLDDVSSYLQGHEVRVVVYLRRQDQLYSSFYNQDVKGVRQWPDSAYEFYQTHQIFQQDYYSLLDVWGGVFGKKHIIIRPFEPEQWVGGDIVQDFCDATGSPRLSSSYRDHNESLGMEQLYVKRCLNKVRFDKSKNDDVLRVLFKVCPQGPSSGCSYVHKALYRQYREEWLQVNRAISEDYLKSEPLFLRPIPEPDEIELYRINKMDLAGYAKYMFKIFSSGKYSEYRSLFAKATLMALAEQDLWHALEPDDRQRMLSWV
jgi:hypothetical protein